MVAARIFCRRVLAVLALAGPCHAYEADVHFGLTQWLARQAGFSAGQATAIALGNSRVDSGLIDTMELTLEHACVAVFPRPRPMCSGGISRLP